jgi:hypothetical protein
LCHWLEIFRPLVHRANRRQNGGRQSRENGRQTERQRRRGRFVDPAEERVATQGDHDGKVEPAQAVGRSRSRGQGSPCAIRSSVGCLTERLMADIDN